MSNSVTPGFAGFGLVCILFFVHFCYPELVGFVVFICFSLFYVDCFEFNCQYQCK